MAQLAAAETVTPLFSAERIAERVEAIASEIAASSPPDLVIVSILKGSFIFAADLIRSLHRDGLKPEIDFIFLASYGAGTASGGEVKVLRGVETDLAGRDVVIVDDILDSGRTLSFAKALLEKAARGGCAPACWSISGSRARPRSSRTSGLSLPACLRGGLRHGPRPPLSRASLHRRGQKSMTTFTLIAALIGALIPAGGDLQGAHQQGNGPLAGRAAGRRLSRDARHHQRHRHSRVLRDRLSATGAGARVYRSRTSRISMRLERTRST